MENKAVLVVSFGTSHEDTKKKSIDAIEHDIGNAFPDFKLYRAWTSNIIIQKLKARDNTVIPTVPEAMKQMAEDGITQVLIQPTHVINGLENDLMKKDALEYASDFKSLTFGDPLITTADDGIRAANAVASRFSGLKDDQALVLMGHGTNHYSNFIYAALNYIFKDLGYRNIFLATVEAYPSIDSVKKQVRDFNPKEIILAPFMIVAGDHARNDMAGDSADSWSSQFRQEGYDVMPVMQGLGEYPEIRHIFIEHAKRALDK